MIGKAKVVQQGITDETSQAVVLETAYVVPSNKRLDPEEQTRRQTLRLVRQLYFSGPTTSQTVVFSGVEHGSGCTSVCARAAEALSSYVDARICAVDADLRTPSLHRYFDTIGAPDSGDKEFPHVRVTVKGRDRERSNLWLLSAAGTESRMPGSFERLRSRISELRKEFTYILIDTPPINGYAEATSLGKIADGAIMILEANRTRREAALRAKGALNAAGVRLLGAVLNKRTFPIPDNVYWKL
jgi:Mrp family chromosome partitioning ATPase